MAQLQLIDSNNRLQNSLSILPWLIAGLLLDFSAIPFLFSVFLPDKRPRPIYYSTVPIFVQHLYLYSTDLIFNRSVEDNVTDNNVCN